jgi:hypothetical protein
MDEEQARSVAAVGATDPGSILVPDGHGHDHDHGDHHHHSDHDHDHDAAQSGEPAPAG